MNLIYPIRRNFFANFYTIGDDFDWSTINPADNDIQIAKDAVEAHASIISSFDNFYIFFKNIVYTSVPDTDSVSISTNEGVQILIIPATPSFEDMGTQLLKNCNETSGVRRHLLSIMRIRCTLDENMFRFMELPREIRDNIYSMAIGDEYVPCASRLCRYGGWGGHSTAFKNQYSVVAVSRHFREESLCHATRRAEVIYHHVATMHRMPARGDTLSLAHSHMNHVMLNLRVAGFRLRLNGKSARHECVSQSKGRRCEYKSISSTRHVTVGLRAPELASLRLVTPSECSIYPSRRQDEFGDVFVALSRLICAMTTVVVGWPDDEGSLDSGLRKSSTSIGGESSSKTLNDAT